jgi:trimeric autotransporter adhesin
MNKIFRIIWNKTTQRLEVVSELAKSQGKAKASTDKRESLNDSSLKGFKLTQGLKPLSLLVAFAIAMPSYATITEHNRNQPNSLHIWGKRNVTQGNVSEATTQAAVIAGTGNALGDERENGVFFAYDNRTDESGVQKTPNGINIFGRDNKVNVGNKVNVVGINNTILNNAIGNSGINLAINAMGNNIAVMNPRRSSYFGNDINANSAYLGIGNNLTIAAGGQAVGTDISLSGNSMAFGSSISTGNANNFLVGSDIKATNQNQFISGKNITSGLLGASLMGRDITINQGWADNLVAVGNSLTVNAPNTNSAANAVVMGVSSTITGGAKAVTIGSNVTSNSASNSVTIGSDISTNKPNTVTIGSGNTKTEQNYSIAIGNNASTLNNSNDNGIAIGRNSVVRGDSGIALGLGAESYNAVDVAIGRNSKTDAKTNSTLSAWNVSGENVLAKYNKQGTIQTTGSDNGGVVSFGSSTVKRQLKNVAAGDVSATSTDAINGAQLYALAEVVKPGTLTINAGTTKVADWKANSDKAIGFESTNSNLAVSADTVNGKVKFTLANDLSVNSVTASGVEIGKNNVAVNANNKKITRLADAELTTTSTEAVTGRQLQATNENVTNVQNIANTAKQAADNAAAAVSNSYLHVKSSKAGNLAALNANGGATGDNSVALGPNATAAGASSIAIGDEAVTGNNQGTIAIGQNAAANSNNATVIGRDAKTVAAATDSVVIGLGSIATSTSATAIGKNANASGASSISIGQNTVTTGSATAALGYNVTATADNATAVGSYGNASGKDSVTVGAASASNNNAVAIGKGANATGSSGTAVGTEAAAAGGSSSAFGQKANATGLASLALGYQANATGNWTVAVGGDSKATGDFTVAMGNRANASALNATSIGIGSAASGVNATALGAGANAAKDKSLALGRGATANIAEGDVAIGDSSVTAAANAVSDFTIGSTTFSASNFVKETSNGVVSVGSGSIKRQIQNVGAGAITATSSDAINGSQLYHIASALDKDTTGYVHVNKLGTSDDNDNLGKYGATAGAMGKGAIAIGIAAKATNANSIAIGSKSKNGSISALAMGDDTVVAGYSQHSIAIGTAAKLGVDTKQTVNERTYRSVAIGHQASVGIKDDGTGVMAEDAVALGSNTSVQANNGVAIGRSAKAKHASSVALGHESETQDEANIDSVADLFIDGKEVAKKGVKKTDGKGSISVGKNGLNRQIFNVGAGRISADSTDAINGSQLFHVANATKTAIQGIKDTTFTFNIANGVTDATLNSGSQLWSIGARNSITFGATSDLSVTRKDGFIVYGLSDAIKNDIKLAKDTANQAKATAEAAKTIAQEAKNNSPYEIWKAKPENTNKSKDDFLTSLKGAKGDAGAAGAAGADGKSAFDTWKDANNKPNATEAEFLAATKGDTGADGKSAFDTWKDANNKPNATKAEFLAATKGEKGDKGDTGPVGPRGPKGDAGTGGSEAKVAKVTTDNSGNLSVKPKANGDTEITLNKDLQGLSSISIGSGPSAVSIMENGLNNGGHRITNVAAGVKPTDAANVAQVNAVENRLNNKIGKLDKKLRGGIANAVAVANIPQVTIPGANMVAVGTGNYKGQSALAVGYSRASDNNRVIIKMSASATTQGDYSVGGGIGYQW